ncbi:hypothetical protein, partial [Enterobacter cloacae]|uniref:hypothetical protein n=1 Tax=Enterobacter cloacae TaxID=550 RepID=UPI00351015D8
RHDEVSSDLLAQPVDHTSSCFSFFWGTLSPVGEGRGEGIKPHFPPKFDPLTLFSQKRLPRICSLLIMIIIVTLIVIYKHYVTYG